MQIKRRLYSAFVVILLTASSLLIFICMNNLAAHTSNPLVPIPKEADWIIRIDMENLIKQEIYNTIFDQKDDPLLEQIRAIIQERKDLKTDSKNLHIDLQEDCIAYQFEKENQKYIALVFKTTDADAFNEAVKGLPASSFTAYAQGNYAILLYPIGNNSLNINQLNNIINQLFKEQKKEISKFTTDKREFLTINIPENKKSPRLRHLSLGIQTIGNSLVVEGTTSLHETISSSFHFGLNPKGLYISSRIIPNSLPDTIFSFLPKNLPHLQEIEAFAVDFQGTYLEEPLDSLPNVVGFLPTPVINLIIKTKKPCDVQKLWEAFPAKLRRNALQVSFGNTTYHLKQLNKYTYFIGVDPSAITDNTDKEVVSIRGTLHKMTKIYGSTFVTTFIENTGFMKSLNTFLRSSESVDFHVTSEQDKSYQIRGEITFKERKQPIHELTKLGLDMRSLIQ